jgi:hypothetical protein
LFPNFPPNLLHLLFVTKSSSTSHKLAHHFTPVISPCQQFVSATAMKSLHILVWSQWSLYQYSHSDAVLVPDCWRELKTEGANNTGHIPRGWASSQLGLLPNAGLWESGEREFCATLRRF